MLTLLRPLFLLYDRLYDQRPPCRVHGRVTDRGRIEERGRFSHPRIYNDDDVDRANGRRRRTDKRRHHNPRRTQALVALVHPHPSQLAGTYL